MKTHVEGVYDVFALMEKERDFMNYNLMRILKTVIKNHERK